LLETGFLLNLTGVLVLNPRSLFSFPGSPSYNDPIWPWSLRPDP
jgi:hypothetical protein